MNRGCGTAEQLRTKGPQDVRPDDPLCAAVHRVLLDAAIDPRLGRCRVLLPEAADDLRRHRLPDSEHTNPSCIMVTGTPELLYIAGVRKLHVAGMDELLILRPG